jgi:quercetin dioxygenase-like cupin family protein
MKQQVTTILYFLIFTLLFGGCRNDNTLPDPLAAGWRGQSVCEEVINNEKMRVLKCTFPPGVGHEKHFHPEHFGYALSGSTFRITDSSGTREVALESGSHFYSEGTEWHEVLNIGDSTAVYLIIEPK